MESPGSLFVDKRLPRFGLQHGLPQAPLALGRGARPPFTRPFLEGLKQLIGRGETPDLGDQCDLRGDKPNVLADSTALSSLR